MATEFSEQALRSGVEQRLISADAKTRRNIAGGFEDRLHAVAEARGELFLLCFTPITRMLDAPGAGGQPVFAKARDSLGPLLAAVAAAPAFGHSLAQHRQGLTHGSRRLLLRAGALLRLQLGFGARQPTHALFAQFLNGRMHLRTRGGIRLRHDCACVVLGGRGDSTDLARELLLDFAQ